MTEAADAMDRSEVARLCRRNFRSALER